MRIEGAMRLWIPVIVPAAVLADALLAAGQAAQPAAARPVTLFVNVTDRDDRPVEGLTREQFQIRDNGRPVQIADFNTSPEPLTMLLLVDASASMAPRLDAVTEAGSRFVATLEPGDRARVGGFAQSLVMTPAFTSDRDALLRSLRQDLRSGAPTSLWDTLDAAFTLLDGEPGRRVILAVTDGVDSASTVRASDLLDRAHREDVSVHVIAPVNRYFNGRTTVSTEPDPVLRRLATDTGGIFAEVSSDHELAPSFDRVVDALRRAYALTFSPSQPDGRVHRLQVSVDVRGARVRARQRYLAHGTR